MFRATLLVFAAVCVLGAQTTNPLIAEGKATYTQVKNNIIKAAEKMPEDQYGFQPVPEIRTFGALMGHIADAQLGNCSTVRGERKPGTAGSLKTKAELQKALADSFAECDAAWDSITDANATEMAGRRSKLGLLLYNIMHSDEEYGYASVYLRLKGIVPPSSEGGMGRGRKGE